MHYGTLIADGYRFKTDVQYRRYRGLKGLLDSGRIESLQVNPRFALIVNGVRVAEYSPTFVFYDPERQIERVVHVGDQSNNHLMMLKIRLFEVLYQRQVESWV